MDRSEQIELDDARRMVFQALTPLPTVALELDCALGRVIAEDVVAERPLPAFDSSAMDGFAVRASDLAGARTGAPATLRVVDESRAGRPARAALARGQAIAISTGAMIPAGADAVVRIEDTRREDGVVEVLGQVTPGEQVRRAGEDVQAGATVLARGATLGPAQLGALASLGRAHVTCARPPRVSLLVTGDELLAAGEPLRAGAIRDSNSHAIIALARCAGADVIASEVVGDDEQRTRSTLAIAAADADAVIVCGGMSVGAHDHVRPSLRALGATQAFWGLALRPGHPTWFGSLKGTPVFGLPGNPVSAIVTFVLLAGPALRAMQGAPPADQRPSARLDVGYEKPAGRAHALRCRLTARDDGWHVRPTGPQGSHVLSSMLAADALAIVPSAVTRVTRGERVQVEPLARWTGGWA
ncbi:MAG TPA: gephyrin-like molybdotransferase Glp [Solirubrobacteraceae bacterium]|nr:gephyrin-like molybdotransferase Glp [Solirubrobacteraceae bacterium]